MLFVALAATALGYGAARIAAPTPRNEELARLLQRQIHQHDELVARLAAMQSQLGELQARPLASSSAAAAEAAPPAAVAAAVAVAETEVLDAQAFPDSETSLARGYQLLERAVASQRWGASEIEEMRKLMDDMSGPARLEIAQAVAAAINRGELKGRLSSLFAE